MTRWKNTRLPQLTMLTGVNANGEKRTVSLANINSKPNVLYRVRGIKGT